MHEIPVTSLKFTPRANESEIKAIADEINQGIVDIDVRLTDNGYAVVNGNQRLLVALDKNATAHVRDVKSREVFQVRRDSNGAIVRI